MHSHITLSNIDYLLPNEKIAFFPLENRDQSKLLVYKNKTITDAHFADLPDFLDEDCALIFNVINYFEFRLKYIIIIMGCEDTFFEV